MTSDNHLLRDKAPMPVLAWKTVDAEAKERLTPLLAGRRLTDWVGPGGWRHDALSLGRAALLDDLPLGMASTGLVVRQRRVQPLAEFRVAFTVDRAEIDDIQRGSRNPELDDLARAAAVAAELENRAILLGWPGADMEGMAASSPHPELVLGDDCSTWPTTVALAVDQFKKVGIEGPYAIVLSPERYTHIIETTEQGGYLLLDHLTRILGGGDETIVRASGLDRTAVVVSNRGGDFLLDVGQDLSIGYSHHDAEQVHLYLEESFTFLVAEPDAVVRLS